MPNTCPLPPAQVATIVGRAFARLHKLSVKACPFDETIATRLARAKDNIARGLIEPEEFDDRNRGVAPEAICERLMRRPPAEDIVVVHGDATLSNVLIDDDGQAGFVDCGHCGRSDRYQDLALLAADIAENFGPRHVAAFRKAYGLEHVDRELDRAHHSRREIVLHDHRLAVCDHKTVSAIVEPYQGRRYRSSGVGLTACGNGGYA